MLTHESSIPPSLLAIADVATYDSTQVVDDLVAELHDVALDLHKSEEPTRKRRGMTHDNVIISKFY